MIDFIKIFGIVLIPILILLYLLKSLFMKKESINLKIESKNPRIAFLLPARNEEKVIGDLLDSINKQTYKIDMKNVFVIVQDKKDKTGNVAKKYGVTVLYRTTDIKTKGKALDDGIKQILKKQHFDLYYIFDADNVLDKDFVKNSLNSYYLGYDLALGYRNTKNGNENVVAGASSLIFSLVNTIINKRRKKNNKNLVISGTGFFIKGKWIDKWQEYPFQTLTEDYEISLYASQNGLTTDYVENAIFYDEQPTSYKQTVVQRKRWIKGYFDSTKLYLKNNKGKGLINVFPIIAMLCIIISYIILEFIILCINKKVILALGILFTIIIFIYMLLSIITIYILCREKGKLNINKKMGIKLAFYHPIFLFGYVECAILLLFNRNVEWNKIEHKAKMKK